LKSGEGKKLPGEPDGEIREGEPSTDLREVMEKGTGADQEKGRRKVYSSSRKRGNESIGEAESRRHP